MLSEDKQAINRLLGALIEQYIQLSKAATGSLPSVEYDADWQSSAQQGPSVDGRVCWQPVPQQEDTDFSGVETAIGIQLPDVAKAYWQCFYGGNIGVTCDGYDFELLQPWNPADLERYQENLIGHLLLQKKRRIPPSMFIGCGVSDERILSVTPSGSVIWEWPGNKQQVELAPTLSTFLQTCEVRLLTD